MQMIMRDPVLVELPPGLDEKLLRSVLTYTDKRMEFAAKKFKNSASWLINKMGEEAWKEEYERLLSFRKQVLLFSDKDENQYTYSGLTNYLKTYFPDLELENLVKYPEPNPIPWMKSPKVARPYQIEAHRLLLEKKHANVEIGTGLGKSFIILNLVRDLGLKTVIMAPSISIANQLFKDHIEYLGKKYVGAYFDSKKCTDKLITVATGQSLTRLEPGSQGWIDLAQTQVFIADESHLTPAETLTKVCLGNWENDSWNPGLVANAPWRFFFSGTQLRSDGLGLLLKAIIGPTVFSMSVEEGVNQGFLAKPHFSIVNMESKVKYFSKDPNNMTRKHLYENAGVGVLASKLINKFATSGKKVLVLIDELGQVMPLINNIKTEFGLAHGGVTQNKMGDPIKNTQSKKGNSGKLPEYLHKSDPEQLVSDFNAGKLPVLIGTSCIWTGTDIRPPGGLAIIYLAGGQSEVQFRQCVGRGTRIDGKSEFYFVDFDITNVDVLHRHAATRRAFCADIYSPAKDINL